MLSDEIQPVLCFMYSLPHLSKGPSDLKQNGTQEKTPFSCPVFHCLSCGVVRFVPTVSFWNHQIEASHWLMEEFWPVRKWFLELTLGTKRTTPHAGAQKTLPENYAFSGAPFCLRSVVRFERCGYLKAHTLYPVIFQVRLLLQSFSTALRV